MKNETDEIGSMYSNLINTEIFIFPSIGKVNITNNQGVYIIYNPDFRVLHVGKTNGGKEGLNQRLQNHINNQSSFSKQYLNWNGKILRNGYKFRFVIEADSRKRALLEALATGLLCPAHIGTGEKK